MGAHALTPLPAPAPLCQVQQEEWEIPSWCQGEVSLLQLVEQEGMRRGGGWRKWDGGNAAM